MMSRSRRSPGEADGISVSNGVYSLRLIRLYVKSINS